VRADVDGFAVGERCNGVVRPEKLWITPEGEKVDGNLPSVEGLVESSLYLGTATQMIVRLPDDVVLTVLCPNTDEAERRSLPGGGAKVKLSWAPEHMHLVRSSPGTDGRAGDGAEASDKAEAA
jgi:ABC-type Fe3+/spermidine/putrescine transport system ATPase subunit